MAMERLIRFMACRRRNDHVKHWAAALLVIVACGCQPRVEPQPPPEPVCLTEFNTVGRPFSVIANIITVLNVTLRGAAQCDDGLHEIEWYKVEIFDEAGKPVTVHHSDFVAVNPPSREVITVIALTPPPGVIVIRLTTNVGVMETAGVGYHGYWPDRWEALASCFPLELPDGGVVCRGDVVAAPTDSMLWQFSGRSLEARRIDDETRDASVVHRDVFSAPFDPVYAARGSRLVVAAPDALFVFDEDGGVRQQPLQARIQALRFRDDTSLFAARGQLTEVITLDAPFTLSSKPGAEAEVFASDEGFWRLDRSSLSLSLELPDGGRLAGKAPNGSFIRYANVPGRVPYFELGNYSTGVGVVGVARLLPTGEVRVDAIAVRPGSQTAYVSNKWLYSYGPQGVARTPRTME